MSFRIAFASLCLLIMGLAAVPASAQHGRGNDHRRHHRNHRPAPRRVIVVAPNHGRR